jgi:hypothetical protein
MAPKKKVERPQENVSLGPQVREGELVFGVARIFASFVRFYSIPGPAVVYIDSTIAGLQSSQLFILTLCVERHLRPRHRSFVRLKTLFHEE